MVELKDEQARLANLIGIASITVLDEDVRRVSSRMRAPKASFKILDDPDTKLMKWSELDVRTE